MANWLYQCDIKQFFTDDDEPNLGEIVNNIKEELYKKVPSPMRSHAFFQHAMRRFDRAVQLDEVPIFDDGLNSLYDWADHYKVWLGI